MAKIEKLTVDVVPQLWKHRENIFADKSVALSPDMQVDSSGIAFLVQWAKHLPQRRLIIINAPTNAIKLIKMFRLEELFEVKA